MTVASSARPTPFHFPAYRAFWAARVLSVLAIQAQGVTIAWQVYAIARRTGGVRQASFAVGMIGLAQFLPMIALALNAGEAADRHDRRKILLVCMMLEAATALVLAAMAMAGGQSMWPMYAMAVAFGTSRAFLNPANSALSPMLVPAEVLPRALAWNALANRGAQIVGPALGGVFCVASPGLSFAICAGLYLAAALALTRIRGVTRPAAQAASRWMLVKEGLAYVWTNRIVFGAISLDLAAVLLGGATALLPVYARDVLHVGVSGFGVLRAAPAAGALLIAVGLARRPIHARAGWFIFGGVAVFGVATLVFALSKSLALSVFALAVLGGADMLSVYVRQTLIQIVTPDVMRGRVSAVATLFVGASNELGEFESGLTARILGPVGAAVFGGVGALVVTGVWAKLFPALRKADRLV